MSEKIHEFIENLVLRRMEKGVSQTKLAERMGYSRFTLLKWELMERRPRLDNLFDWIDALGGKLTLEWDDEEEERK